MLILIFYLNFFIINNIYRLFKNDYILSYIPQTIEQLSIKIIDNRKINLVNFIKLKVLNLFILVT